MNKFLKMFAVALCVFFFSFNARAATVTVIPAESVGLSDVYWAGIVMLDVNGQRMLGMFDNLELETDRSLPLLTSWEANLYTQADILGGASVNFSPERYSNAAPFFLNGLLGHTPPDALWAAGFNEMVWNVVRLNTPAIQAWYYATLPYDGQSTLMDVYNSMLPGLNPNYDYSGSMMILANAYDPATGTWPNREMFVYPLSTMSTPIPSAIWLFVSGMLGLVAVARTKTRRS